MLNSFAHLFKLNSTKPLSVVQRVWKKAMKEQSLNSTDHFRTNIMPEIFIKGRCKPVRTRTFTHFLKTKIMSLMASGKGIIPKDT